MTVEFWVTSIVVTATPGTGALFTIAAGLGRGVRAGLVAAAGSTLGVVPHMALAVTGAAATLAASPVAFEAIKWLGVVYLVYMAWGSWRQTGVLAPLGEKEAPGGDVSTARVVGGAVLVNLLNPKLTVFFFVFLPIFVDTSVDGAAIRMAGLGALFMVITLLIFAVYGACAAWMRRYVIGRPIVMRRIGRLFAASFLVLAVMLAFSRR
ncbi:LysE family translocator [Streptomyces otsuchiensis]|uniref:LysE family translocator n=1 Tax=Streptomyces otsuchiensis TaxID=2681388 RepID=UPI0010324A09|nr:LysE family translocator [Streptomyces otsuchiensis]